MRSEEANASEQRYYFPCEQAAVRRRHFDVSKWGYGERLAFYKKFDESGLEIRQVTGFTGAVGFVGPFRCTVIVSVCL